jgi:hypothetical protein
MIYWPWITPQFEKLARRMTQAASPVIPGSIRVAIPESFRISIFLTPSRQAVTPA